MVDHNWPFLPTWSLLKHHIGQILQVDEENESSDPKQQQKPEGAGRFADGHPHPPPTAKKIHHLTIHKEHHSSERKTLLLKERETQIVNTSSFTEEETSLLIVKWLDGKIKWCCFCIYMYAFGWCHYPKHLIMHSSSCIPWESNLWPWCYRNDAKNFSQYYYWTSERKKKCRTNFNPVVTFLLYLVSLCSSLFPWFLIN